MFARATWYASGLGFFAKRPPPWIAIVVKCSRLRTQETHKFGVQQNGDTQIQGFCSERLHAQETARHKRCFGSGVLHVTESSVRSLLMFVFLLFLLVHVRCTAGGAERSRAARPPAACEPRTAAPAAPSRCARGSLPQRRQRV